MDFLRDPLWQTAAAIVGVAVSVAAALFAQKRTAPSQAGRTHLALSAVRSIAIILVAITAMAAIVFGARAFEQLTSPSTFSDSLTSTNDTNWQPNPACTFTSGGLRISGDLPQMCISTFGHVGEAMIDVHAEQVEGDVSHGYGIAFRTAAACSSYYFGIRGDGTWAFFYTTPISNSILCNIQDLALWRADSAISKGLAVINALEVRSNGPDFDFFVNGIHVGHSFDQTYQSGQTGLWTAGSLEAVFTSFSIDSLDS